MSDKNDGGPAFPSPAFDNCALPGCEGGPMRGMTLRDWFAGLAMQGTPPGYFSDIENTASRAYDIADAMLAERSK